MDNPVLRDDHQEIIYTGSQSEFCTRPCCKDVVVRCCDGKHTQGSSKMKLVDRIDYNWEYQYYYGQLISAHIHGEIVAYAMKNKDGGMVRVTNQISGERTLIKNRKKEIKDVAFSFSKNPVILGCVDSEGSVWIYNIIDKPKEISHVLLLQLFHRNASISYEFNYRIIWCPYFGEIGEEDLDPSDDAANMFAILNGSKAEIWNFHMINEHYGDGPLEPKEDYKGFVQITQNCDIIDAAFSSDGGAIAIVCDDGYVRFYQLTTLEAGKVKFLHEWMPHKGKNLSSIIFVDNLVETSSQCWKFVVTGANYNSELKLWSCETWCCLQRITFKTAPEAPIRNVFLKIAIDYTGQFIVISDINNKALYVLELARDDDLKLLSIKTLSQFLLPTTFLSFHVLEANLRIIRPTETASNGDYCHDSDDDPDTDDLDLDSNDGEYNGLPTNTIVVKLLVIQPKKFQACNIVYQSENLELVNGPCIDTEKGEIAQQPSPAEIAAATAATTTNITSSKDTTKIPEKRSEVPVQNLIDFQRPEKEHFTSGGSSPSREVQEILFLNNSASSPQDYFDTISSMDVQENDSNGKPIPKSTAAAGVAETGTNNNETYWPKVPIVNDNEVKKTESNKIVTFRLNCLENLIRDQLGIMRQIIKNSSNQTQLHNVKDDILKSVDVMMTKQQLQIAKILENVINRQKEAERQRHERILNDLTLTINKNLIEKIVPNINNEIRSVLVPLTESISHKIDAQKVTNSVMLEEKVTNLIKSPVLADSIGKSVTKILPPILEKVYKDVIASTLIPSWEKACSTMFQQINETFSKGTKEYTASVEAYMDKQKRTQDKGRDLVNQMQDASQQMQTNSEKMMNIFVNEIRKEFTNTNANFKLMQEVLSRTVHDVVNEQIGIVLKNHMSVLEDSVLQSVRSRTVTPSPRLERQVSIAHVDHLLTKEEYVDAFQLALSAENLNFVIHVCSKVDVNTLFQRNPPQNCILALIQQLSMDLINHTDLKFSYLRASLVALVPDHPNTKQYLPKILKDLLRHLQLFMAHSNTIQNPNQMYDAKLLKMAIESILAKI